jgi:hypothetical protein
MWVIEGEKKNMIKHKVWRLRVKGIRRVEFKYRDTPVVFARSSEYFPERKVRV